MNTNMYARAIEAQGMTITSARKQGNIEIVEAFIVTKRGILTLAVGTNGAAVLWKPNGATKWLHKKTPAQFNSILKQTIAYNN